jgi:hypothetical protein
LTVEEEEVALVGNFTMLPLTATAGDRAKDIDSHANPDAAGIVTGYVLDE